MVDDQLAGSVEEIRKRFFALRGVKHVRLFDFDLRQRAALPAKFIALPSELFLLFEQLLTSLNPFLSRNDRMCQCRFSRLGWLGLRTHTCFFRKG